MQLGCCQAQIVGSLAFFGLLCCVGAVSAHRPEHLLHGANTLLGLTQSGDGFDLNQVFAVSSTCLTVCALIAVCTLLIILSHPACLVAL
jgi:hypothetical protein